MRWIMLLALAACGTDTETETDTDSEGTEPVSVRVATFNVSMYRSNPGDLVSDLAGQDLEQAQGAAAIIQTVRPDILLLNEMDWDAQGAAVANFKANYLEVSQDGKDPITYPHVYIPRSNTGVHSGLDINNDGRIDTTPGSDTYANDCYGYGLFEGQYGYAVLSMHPIDEDSVRTFQELLWKDMPNNLIPTDFYSPDQVDILRLSSKNHADVPIDVDGRTLHFLVSHPTPPAFDGPEDRNGRRNHDEFVFWKQYVEGQDWMTDDAGTAGGLPDAHFVIAGDQNADPFDGDSTNDPAGTVLSSDRVQDPLPESEGGVEQSELQGGANDTHIGDPKYDTASFNPSTVGNLRIDYVLPSDTVDITGSGVFWPLMSEPDFEYVGTFPYPVSDHRLVWVDIEIN